MRETETTGREQVVWRKELGKKRFRRLRLMGEKPNAVGSLIMHIVLSLSYFFFSLHLSPFYFFAVNE
jgi:hypothetical protein